MIVIPVTAGAVEAAGKLLDRAGIVAFVEAFLQVPTGYLQSWYQDNLIRWVDKRDAENAKRRAAGQRPIPPSLLMPALHKIAMEDNDDMLGMWARLFVNFQDPDRRLEPNKIYVHLLAEMQPLDAKILEHMVTVLPDQQRIVVGVNSEPVGVNYVTPDQISQDLSASDEAVLLSLHNLHRLGCLSPTRDELSRSLDGASLPKVPWVISEDGNFYLNSLGVALVRACQKEPAPAD